jgi:hypothetical protein
MEWTDEGIVLGVRRHGESSAIVELLTRGHGRHLGLVRGGAGSRMRPLLQPGNSVRAVWRARLDEHLGYYAIEGTRLRAATVLASSHAVYGVTHLASLARLLPERCATRAEERYLAYALSTIMHRALPDARDGLKPVHRRILYGMRLLRLDPGTPFKKCAKIVGDVMGSFHPHGDQAIYDALVRLAQDFASRYPLVDGQGNFGNIDGDNPPPMRYTEARMTEVARLLLDGIDEDASISAQPTTAESKSRSCCPAAFPEPARQRLAGHRGRHGDLDPAAQRGRAVRRGAAPDRQSERESRRRC